MKKLKKKNNMTYQKIQNGINEFKQSIKKSHAYQNCNRYDGVELFRKEWIWTR